MGVTAGGRLQRPRDPVPSAGSPGSVGARRWVPCAGPARWRASNANVSSLCPWLPAVRRLLQLQPPQVAPGELRLLCHVVSPVPDRPRAPRAAAGVGPGGANSWPSAHLLPHPCAPLAPPGGRGAQWLRGKTLPQQICDGIYPPSQEADAGPASGPAASTLPRVLPGSKSRRRGTRSSDSQTVPGWELRQGCALSRPTGGGRGLPTGAAWAPDMVPRSSLEGPSCRAPVGCDQGLDM